MTSALIAVTGVDYWTLADGTKHPCGFWPEEIATPHKIFTDAGLAVTFATPGGVPPVADEAGYLPAYNGGSAEAGQALAEYIESLAPELNRAAVLEDIDPAEYDFVFVPGGHGPMEDLAVSERFGEIVRAFFDAGKPVAALCHGPAALLPAKAGDGGWLFSGFELTAFSNVEEEQVGFADKAEWLLEDRLRSGGGIYSSATEPWGERVVVDRNLYTGQNPASSAALARRLVSATAR